MASATLSAQFPGYVKARTTNSTDAAYPSRVPTITAPTGNDGTVIISGAPTWLSIIPYAIGTAAQTITVKVVAWRKFGDTQTTDGTLWVPTPVLEFVATLGTQTGVVASDVLNTELFATSLATPTTGIGSVGVNCQSYSPGDNTIGHFMLDLQGASVIEVLFKIGSATSANALLCLF